MRRLLASVVAVSVVAAAWFVWRNSSPAAERQIALGEELYREHCATCHDIEGGTGPALTQDVLRSYRSARTLFDYVSIAMPDGVPGTLADEEYWRVLAFLLDSRSLVPADVRVSAEIADQLLLGH